MLRHEFKRMKRNKAFILVTFLIILLGIINSYTAYLESESLMLQGVSYLDAGMNRFESHRFFFTYMFDMTLTVFIFPFVLIVSLLVSSDIKGKFYLQLAVVKGASNKYFVTKIKVLFMYNIIMLVLLLIILTVISLFLPMSQSKDIMLLLSLDTFFQLVIYWLGLSCLGIMAMMGTYLFKSSLAGAGVFIYIIIERIFVSNIAILLQNPFIMKCNEFLPWTNLNTLFVYGSDLNYLTSHLTIEQQYAVSAVLTMFTEIEVEGVKVVYPYLKDIYRVVGIVVMYLITSICMAYYALKKLKQRG